jgi:hypothetical protein
MKRPAVHSVHRPSETREAPVPVGTGASKQIEGAALLQGPTPSGRGVGGRRVLFQRQRIDMIRPRIIAPKPIAKFHADRDTMNGIRSPAT